VSRFVSAPSGIILPILFSLFLVVYQSGNKEVIDEYINMAREGARFTEEGDYQKSIAYYKRALELSRKFTNKTFEAQALMGLALVSWNIGNLKESASFYKNALDIAESIKLTRYIQKCRIALRVYNLYINGKNACSLGNYQDSIGYFEESINLAKQIESLTHQEKCIRQMSVNYYYLNKLEEFFYLNLKAQKIANNINNLKEEGICFNNIGLYYWKMCSYSNALNYLHVALDIATRENQLGNKADCLANLSLVYQDLGDYDRSLEYLLEVLGIDKKIGNDINISIDMNNIGIFYLKKGKALNSERDFENARECFMESLKMAEKNQNKKIEGAIHNNLGETFLKKKDFSAALESFDLGLQIAYAIQDIELISIIHNNIGYTNLSMSCLEKAKANFMIAIEHAQKINNIRILWEALFGLGQYYEKAGDIFSAADYYKKSINIIEDIRGQIYIDAYMAGYTRSKLEVYENLIELLLCLYAKDNKVSLTKEIFNYVEKAKARAFLENLSFSRINYLDSLSDDQRLELNRAAGHLASLFIINRRIDLNDKRRADAEKQFDLAEDYYLRLINNTRIENQANANFISSAVCQFNDVQKNFLTERTAVFEYFLGEKCCFVLVITKKSFEIYHLPPRSQLEKSLKGYLKYMTTSTPIVLDAEKIAYRIYRELLFPLESGLYKNIDTLVIIPDGVLNYLPFETLMYRQVGQKFSYLINNYKVSYGPSCSVLAYIRNQGTSYQYFKRLLAIGDPIYTVSHQSSGNIFKKYFHEKFINQHFTFSAIPYSRNEIKAISEYFVSIDREIYLGKEAREEIIKNKGSKSYEIIHFACHSFIDRRQPFRSALVLNQDTDGTEDGFLFVSELYNLRLRANLVILSGCQTANGTIEQGEGILGLTRAFFYAGANSVISTLWAINDKSTVYFMKKLYFFLSKGSSKVEALRLAKCEMLRSGYSHPFYWAAFILSGDTGIVFH
jgi:CHAT domain-containing protein